MIEGNAENSSDESGSESQNGAADKSNGAPQSSSSANSSSSSENSSQELYNGMPKDKYKSFKPQSLEKSKGSPMEVVVDHGVERAIKVLKRKLIRDGLFKELKSRRYFTKPSEEKKRRLKESLKKIRKEESRRQKSQLLF